MHNKSINPTMLTILTFLLVWVNIMVIYAQPNNAPSIDLVSNHETCPSSSNFTTSIEVSDIDGDALSFTFGVSNSMITNPTAITINHVSGNTYNISGPLTQTTGSCYLIINAFDGNGGQDTDSLLLTIYPKYSMLYYQEMCYGDPAYFNGVPYFNSGIYSDTFSTVHGCDSILTLNLIVLPLGDTIINESICSGDGYWFGGSYITTPGTYYNSGITVGGCDSFITLNLTVLTATMNTINVSMCQGDFYVYGNDTIYNASTYFYSYTASNGCDSIIVLDIALLPNSYSYTNTNICQGQNYSFGSNNITTTGTYFDTLTATNGCDSIIQLDINVLPTITTLLYQDICQGQSFIFNGNNITSAGTYLDTLTSIYGCDSIVQLDINLLPTITTALYQDICQGQSYIFNGNNITSAGTYLDTLTSINGCDSIIQLDINVLPTITTVLYQDICQGQSYIFNGNNITSAGTYLDTLTSINGCDSIIQLDINVLPTITTVLYQDICQGQSYLFNGNNITSAGTYLDTLTSSNGCDSIVQLDINLLPTITTVLYQNICQGQSFIFNGNNITTAGTYLDTLTSSNGCDSIIQLDINVLPIITTVLYQDICQGQSFIFNGNNITTAGTYLDTLTSSNGCDSIIQLDINVLPTITTVLYQDICQGQSYLFNGNNITSAGTYLDTLTSSNGCDSIIQLDINVLPVITSALYQDICQGQSYLFNGNNITSAGTYLDTLTSSNGCDSIVQLDINILPTITTVLYQDICQGQSYYFNGNNITTTGTYLDTLTSSNGCDSIIQLNINVLPTITTVLYQDICQGQSFIFNGNNITTTGTYLDTLTSSNGCDSIIQLDINVLPIITTVLYQDICQGQSYLFNGNNITSAGTYLDTLTSSNGCDSIIQLDINVLPTITTVLYQDICQGQSLIFNGNNITSAGTYLDTLTSSNGCDSIIQLDINVLPTITTVLYQDICQGQSYYFNGNNITSAGTYLDTLTSSNGCDSIVQLDINVLPTITTVLYQDICQGQSYLFNGNNITSAGTYLDTLTSINGCDSIVQLDINVLPTITTVLYQDICQGQSFIFNGNNITSAGTYLDTLMSSNGCDSIIQLDINVLPTIITVLYQDICQGQSFIFNGNNITSAGTYLDTLTSINGCDSIVQLDINVLPTITTVLYQDICQGQSYLFNGNNITSAGTYLDTLTSINGCDSMVQLDINLLPTITTVLYQDICQGQSYLFNGNNITSAGTYLDTLTSINGCDSIIQLDINILPIITTAIYQNICPGQSYYFNGNNITTTGIYFDTLSSVNGCDSMVQLTLNVIGVTNTSLNAVICHGEHYDFNGISLTSTGTYFCTLVNSHGCDSIISLNLTVLSTHTTVVKIAICQEKTNQNSVQIDTFSNMAGCDSIVTTITTFNTISRTAIQKSICSHDSIWLSGAYQNQPGVYHDTLIGMNGCDSIVSIYLDISPSSTIDLYHSIKDTICLEDKLIELDPAGIYLNTEIDVNAFNPSLIGLGNFTIQGNYTNQYGCTENSSKTIEIIDCTPSIDYGTLPFINVYPSPSSDGLFQIDLGVRETNYYKIITVDELGRVVYSMEKDDLGRQAYQGHHTMDLSHLSSGVYITRLLTESTVRIQKIRLDK